MPNTMPVNYDHKLILETLKPHATRGWIKRFIAVQNAGPDAWLMLVRDFNIQHQEVEYLVEDIVRALEPPQESQSLVRAEMEQLEAKGQLDISTPELEAEWQKKLNDESDQLVEWKAVDKAARERQRTADLEFLRSKKLPEGTTIPIKNQDPKNNVFKVRPIEENKDVPTTEAVKGEATVHQHSTPAPQAPVAPKPELPNVEHPKELSEAEKEQLAFVPKPPPDKEPEYKDPVIKSVDAVGEDGVAKSYRTPESVDTISGLSQEGKDRLKKNSISTVEAFEGMSHEQAKSILGMPAYQSIKSKLKT